MKEPVPIEVRLGSVPPAGEGNVAFFANLSHIFFDNAGLTEALRAEVEGLETYGGRLLPIIGLLWSGDANLLVMEREPIAELREYFAGPLRLRLPDVVVCGAEVPPSPELVEILRAEKGRRVDGYVTDRKLEAIATEAGLELVGSVAGSQQGNNKLLLHEHLRGIGEPVFEAVVAEAPGEIAAAAAELARRGFRSAAVKSQIGASGIGLIRFETGEPPVVPECLFRDGPCLVQGWVDAGREGIERIASPSVQMLVARDRVHLFDLTDQILSPRSIHEGNVSPPSSLADEGLREEVLRQASVAARWLHAQGYRGTASADFHLAFRRDGGVEVRVCELNARVTGATYPSLLARHFIPRGAWLMRNLRMPEARTAPMLFELLEEEGLLYQADMESGVLPINFNYKSPGRVTKGQFLVIGPDLGSVEDTLRRTVALDDFVFTRD